MGLRCDEGKVRYQSHADATKTIILWSFGEWRRGKGRRTPIRAYRCPFCGFWHVTSHERKSSRK